MVSGVHADKKEKLNKAYGNEKEDLRISERSHDKNYITVERDTMVNVKVIIF